MLANQDRPPASDHAEITRTIRSYIVDNFLLGEDELAPDDSFLDKGIVDSTGVLEVVAFVEDAFDIQIADDDMITGNLDSVESLTRFVMSKLSGAVGTTAPQPVD